MKVHSQKGFTLVELLVSITIMVLVLLGSVQILGEAQQMTQQARYRLLAAGAARSVLETIKDTPLNQVRNISTAAFVPAGLPDGAITIVTNPSVVTNVNVATVTVRVTWRSPKNLQANLQVSTMRSRY